MQDALIASQMASVLQPIMKSEIAFATFGSRLDPSAIRTAAKYARASASGEMKPLAVGRRSLGFIAIGERP
jgi:hypothetical protein